MQILKFCKTLYTPHTFKLLDKMYKYEMDPTSTVGATERTRDAGRTDGRTDGQTYGRNETNIPSPPPPTTSLCGGIMTVLNISKICENYYRGGNRNQYITRPTMERGQIVP